MSMVGQVGRCSVDQILQFKESLMKVLAGSGNLLQKFLFNCRAMIRGVETRWEVCAHIG